MGLERSKPKVRRDRTSQPKMLDNCFFEDQNVDWRNLTPPTEKVSAEELKKGEGGCFFVCQYESIPFFTIHRNKNPFVILR